MDSDLIALEAMIATRESALWMFWSMIGTWVAGIATLMAVLISLYLASRGRRPEINFELDVVQLNNGIVFLDGLGFTISNPSQMNVVINSIGWVTGGESKLYQIFDQRFSHGFPTKIEAGHSAFYFFESNDEWLRSFNDHVKRTGGSLKKLRVCITLATGFKFYFPAKMIVKRINALLK